MFEEKNAEVPQETTIEEVIVSPGLKLDPKRTLIASRYPKNDSKFIKLGC